MKTAKLIIGIISMVLFFLIAMQSCVAGLGNILQENGEVSGSAGIGLALCMLIAGIISVAARKSKAAGFVAGGFYAFGGLLGLTNAGSYSDLVIWSVVAFSFAVVMILGSALAKPQKNEPPKA